MTDHLTEARRLILSASGEITSYSWAPSRTAASKAVDLISEALDYLDAALADAEPLPEGWVSVRVPLSPTTQHNLLEDTPTRSWKSLWTRTRAALVDAYPHPEPDPHPIDGSNQ